MCVQWVIGRRPVLDICISFIFIFLSEVNILMLSYHTVILIIIHLEFLIRTFFCYVIYLLIFVNNSLSKVYGIQVIIIICMVHMRLKISIVLDHIQ